MVHLVQAIADILHVLSYGVLIRQILSNKSVHGKVLKRLFGNILARNLVQKPGNVFHSVHLQIRRPLLQLPKALFSVLQGALHQSHCLHHLPDQGQEAVLFGKEKL